MLYVLILEAPAVSVCSMICTSNEKCLSAVHDKNTSMCYIYGYKKNLVYNSGSGQTYIEKYDCSWVDSADEVNYFSTLLSKIIWVLVAPVTIFQIIFRIPVSINITGSECISLQVSKEQNQSCWIPFCSLHRHLCNLKKSLSLSEIIMFKISDGTPFYWLCIGKKQISSNKVERQQ